MSYSHHHLNSPLSSPPPFSPVQPDHFYSSDDHNTTPSSSRPWLTPDDDPLASKGIPVFKPSMDDFADFEQYMTRVEPWGMRSGIVKIIPPREWTEALPSVKDQLRNVRIKSPIEQIMLGRSGLFRQQNIEKRKAMSVREWAELCAKDDFRAPAVDEVGLKAGGEHTFPTRRTRRAPKKRDTSEEHVDMQLTVVRDEGDEDTTVLGTEHKTTEDDADADADSTHESMIKKRRFQSRTDKEAALAKRAELDDLFLDSFDPATDWLPRGTQPSDYTPSFCNTLERRFWRNCGLGRPAWYGADTAGSLFTDETKEWNVSCLPSLLSRLLPSDGKGLPGVNTPYLYFGMWRATFAWHVEDMDLFSINYIHFGAPKFWYAMPQARAVQLENTLRSCFPSDVASCKQFLRHKSFLASPNLLSQSCCKPNTCVQHAGEFIVTYPRGYHAGFNLGFNCAESVNFALESWLELGRKAEACGCVGDSVRINVDDLLAQREEERERERQKYNDSRKSIEKANSKSSRKHKLDALEHRETKKIKIHIDTKSSTPSTSSSSSSTSSTAASSAPKQKVILKVQKEVDRFPCCLCISFDEEGLLPVHDRPGPRSGCQNYMVRDTRGKEIWRAHEKCAMLVPETWVDEVTALDGSVEKGVFGVDVIVKDRWALRCTLCLRPRAKVHGAPVQCTKGKCLKAFHLSCARSSDPESRIHFSELQEVEKNVIIYDQATTSPANIEGDKDGTTNTEPAADSEAHIQGEQATTAEPSSTTFFKTIKKLDYELLCNQHNPVVAATKRANKLERIRKELLALPSMSRVKLRVSAGVFEVSLLSVNEERGTIEVIWDDGYPRVFKWSSLVWGKLEGQPVGQKPTVVVSKPDPFRIHHSNQTPSSSLTPAPNGRQATSPPAHNPFSSVQVYHPPSTTMNSQSPASGSYSYYSYLSNPSSFIPSGIPGAQYPYIPQSNMQFAMPMQPYAYYANQALGPTSWPGAPLPPPPPLPPTMANTTAAPHLTPPMHSIFSNTAKSSLSSVPFSDQFQQAIAASVASLPFRAEFQTNKPPAATSSALPSPPPSVSTASEKGSSSPSQMAGTVGSEVGGSKAKDKQPSADNGAGTGDGKKVNGEDDSRSTDVLVAIRQMQALSAVDKDVLVKMMEAQPSLREAMNTILMHSANTSVVSS